MNLDKMFVWVTAVVIAFASVGKLDVLQKWIWQAQTKIIYESRTSTWGSPKFFTSPSPKILPKVPTKSIRGEIAL